MAKRAKVDIERVVELREGLGWSHKRIAEALGCSEGSVSWCCLVNAIERPGAPPRPSTIKPGAVIQRGAHVVRIFSDEEDARLLALEAEGLRIGKIAKALGRRPNSVRARLATLARREERAA
ncbi:sigma factor-like helix-turn-helix DNA-binding protein [Bosea sp. TWI1241]|uniref:sigma factor-like helix-turn-helix DNA-binding protein n=1 Tax=Bosea sp. TWI1241 TaxID=3148904 RepID=UPI0032080EC6